MKIKTIDTQYLRPFTLHRIPVTWTNGADVLSRGKIKEIIVTIY